MNIHNNFEKSYQEEIKKLKDEIEMKAGKPVEELYRERDKRFRDAMQLKVPDRVPLSSGYGYLPAHYCGIKTTDAYYNYPKWRQAFR